MRKKRFSISPRCNLFRLHTRKTTAAAFARWFKIYCPPSKLQPAARFTPVFEFFFYLRLSLKDLKFPGFVNGPYGGDRKVRTIKRKEKKEKGLNKQVSVDSGIDQAFEKFLSSNTVFVKAPPIDRSTVITILWHAASTLINFTSYCPYTPSRHREHRVNDCSLDFKRPSCGSRWTTFRLLQLNLGTGSLRFYDEDLNFAENRS